MFPAQGVSPHFFERRILPGAEFEMLQLFPIRQLCFNRGRSRDVRIAHVGAYRSYVHLGPAACLENLWSKTPLQRMALLDFTPSPQESEEKHKAYFSASINIHFFLCRRITSYFFLLRCNTESLSGQNPPVSVKALRSRVFFHPCRIAPSVPSSFKSSASTFLVMNCILISVTTQEEKPRHLLIGWD